MMRDDAVPEGRDGRGYAVHTGSYQSFFPIRPIRGSVGTAAKKLGGLRRRKDLGRAADRHLPRLEYIVGEIRAKTPYGKPERG
jgi:hypothetical protein